jgi:hypothetical protein
MAEDLTTRASGARSASVLRERACRPHRQGIVGTSCCLVPDAPPPDRPDLAIYSQAEQFALGIPPSWDSPDILTNFWNPFRLMPESQVTIRNLSQTATAANAQVLFSIATFGIGQPRSLLGSQIVTLAPGQQRDLTFPFPQAVLKAPEQRIAVHVQILHPSDAKLINNAGSQLLADAYTSKVGRDFSVQFPVVNPTAGAQQISLTLLPNQLGAQVTPAAQIYGPLQQVMATLTLHVPANVHGTPQAPVRSDATIVGRDGSGALLDGLTYAVWIDD